MISHELLEIFKVFIVNYILQYWPKQMKIKLMLAFEAKEKGQIVLRSTIFYV